MTRTISASIIAFYSQALGDLDLEVDMRGAGDLSSDDELDDLLWGGWKSIDGDSELYREENEVRTWLEFVLAASEADIRSLGIEWVDDHATLMFYGLFFARSLNERKTKNVADYLRRRLFPELPPMTQEDIDAALQTEFLDLELDEYRRLKKSGQLATWKGPRTKIGQGGWQVR